jgi:hypothetical protein
VHEEENLNTYMVRFRTMGNDNTLNINIEKSEIKATSKAAAIRVVKEIKAGGIRIDKVEQINKPLEVKVKKKRSIGGYLFLGCMAFLALAKLSQRLFS